MPRRKKNGQSPARVPGGPPPEGGILGQSTAAYYRTPQGHDAAMAYNFAASDSQSGSGATSSTKAEIAKSMQEMFSCLDPEVIDMVLSECDFKVETTMDALLELSVAAEDAVPVPPPVSGFERTAAALLNPHHFPAPQPDQDFFSPSMQPSSPLSTSLLTEELDLLVDQELDTLTAKQEVSEEPQAGHHASAGASLSTFPPSLFPQQPLPELLQSSLNSRSRGTFSEQSCAVGGLDERVSASSPLDQLSSLDEELTERKQPVVDFKHLRTESYADKLKPPLDLAASGRPSAFQVYKKQDPSHSLSGVPPSHPVGGGARSKKNTFPWEPLGYMTSPWNLEAVEFSPNIQRNQGPTFITPVAQTSIKPWPSHAPVSQAPLKPSATIPKSWALSVAPQSPLRQSRLRLEGKLLVLLRGAPGSGKSTLARALLEHNPGGTSLSTDDYFIHLGEYHFDPTALGEAHEWNQKRAKEAFERGTSPIIIDNTNTQGWEMRPYVALALKHRYKVLFREPDTWWKNKPRELERRSTHNVPVEKIRHIVNEYERSVSISSIMGSRMPEWKEQLEQENKNSRPVSSETPDLVGEPGLTEGCKKSQLFSSLPDVSSIGRSCLGTKQEDGTHKSTESLHFQPAGKPTGNPEKDDDMDFGGLDSELDAQLLRNNYMSDQRIPDCIVESVMNEDLKEDELPVAFSESIAQRVPRERPSRRSEFDRMEPADVVKDANQTESEAVADDREGAEVVRDEEEKEKPQVLDFEGDWPTEGCRDQRQMRRRERHQERDWEEDTAVAQEDDDAKTKVQPGPDITGFQKVLDLLQTGGGAVHFGSSHTSSLSMTSEEEILREAGGSEEREQSVNNSRGELPDCVLDWKPADSCGIREANMDNMEELESEREAAEAAAAAGGGDAAPSNDGETTESTCPCPAADSKSTAEMTACHDEVGSHGAEGDVVTKPGAADANVCSEEGKETSGEADGSLVCDVRQSPMCEGSVEAEGAPGISSQERKQRQGRRSGKQCKLALTFTQNCPGTVLNSPDSPTAQHTHSGQSSVNADVSSSLNPDCDAGLNPEASVDLLTQSNSEAHPPSPPPSSEENGQFTQTEPQDFAFLWRLNRSDRPRDDAILAASGCPADYKVLDGNPSCFLPQQSSAVFAAVAVCPFGQREVVYRVVLEKSTQVEEMELGGTHDRLESLCILSRHFKLVAFDTLEDLYDKCHQDLEWTTNLLLDSGERFFKDEDGEEEEAEGARGEEDNQTTRGTPGEVLETRLCSDVLNESNSEDLSKGGAAGFEEQRSGTALELNESIAHSELLSFEHEAAADQSDTTSNPQADLSQHKLTTAMPDLRGGAWGWDSDVGLMVEESRASIEDEIASMDEIYRLLQTELEEIERENKQQKKNNEERGRQNLDIQSVELKLPTEVALQLTELFGPVGLDPGSCSTEDYAVQMDLSLAKLLHLKWKETIQEKQKQAALAFHLLQESSAHIKSVSEETQQSGHSLTNTYKSPVRPHVSLRDIIKEEQVLQANLERTRLSRSDLDRRDGSTSLKENKLFSLFPTIDRHFLLDIFRDHNYSLTQTELFLRSILDEEPVKTVVAPEVPRSDHLRAASKEREKRQRPPESTVSSYQDVVDPEYDDFRAEANLQRSRQLESFCKAAEAHKQGRREVASFYAQQGHLHGQRMREANHRAAVQIFQRVNSSLLPQNILDLHGLHVDEALGQLAQVLQDKTTECEQGLCRPQLSVITGRGNHSQGGVARIRPAVIDYLTNKHYRFTEPNPGLVLVSLK